MKNVEKRCERCDIRYRHKGRSICRECMNAERREGQLRRGDVATTFKLGEVEVGCALFTYALRGEVAPPSIVASEHGRTMMRKLLGLRSRAKERMGNG